VALKDMTAAKMLACINESLDSGVVQRAKELQSKLLAEDGLAKAVAIVDSYMGDKYFVTHAV
jgi:hypothetical protein